MDYHLAPGRPVVSSYTNVGLRMRPGRDALLHATGEAAEIAALCQRVFDEAPLAQGLSAGAAAWARRHFDPTVNVRQWVRFYRRLRSPWRVAWQKMHGVLPVGGPVEQSVG